MDGDDDSQLKQHPLDELSSISNSLTTPRLYSISNSNSNSNTSSLLPSQLTNHHFNLISNNNNNINLSSSNNNSSVKSSEKSIKFVNKLINTIGVMKEELG